MDDIELVRIFLNAALPMFGYSVISAEDGVNGLKKFRENKDKIHVILLDVVMPKLNGIELSKEINNLESNIKVLFMSGDNDILDKTNLQDKIKCISKTFAINTFKRNQGSSRALVQKDEFKTHAFCIASFTLSQ